MPKEEPGTKCSITYENGTLEWFYRNMDDGEDNNQEINYKDFVAFLSKNTNGDITTMNIYHIDNASDATETGDLIENCQDFGEWFDDDTDETIHFKVKTGSGGDVYKVKIDLSEADCKEEIIMTIPKHGFDNSNSTQEEWFNSWQDMSQNIGDKLNDSNWESKYSLNHSKQRDSISVVSDFSGVFKNFALNDDEAVDFSVRVTFIRFIVNLFIICDFNFRLSISYVVFVSGVNRCK